MNPYDVLGVARHAPLADVRKAFRKKALELHPDRNPNGAEAFKAVAAAYETLCKNSTDEREDDIPDIITRFTRMYNSDSHAKINRDREAVASGRRTSVSAYNPFETDADDIAFAELVKRDSENALKSKGDDFHAWRRRMDEERKAMAEEARKKSAARELQAAAEEVEESARQEKRRREMKAEAEREWRQIQGTL